MAKETQKKAAKGGLNKGNIFPLAILLLTGCSPAEPESSFDSEAKI
jgi:hypothetical protein